MVRNERALSFTDNNFELFERDENGKETDKVSAQFKIWKHHQPYDNHPNGRKRGRNA